MKMRKYLKKDYTAFLAHVVDKIVKERRIEDILVVWEFPDVFPEELPGLPQPRQVEFGIDLVPEFIRSTSRYRVLFKYLPSIRISPNDNPWRRRPQDNI